MNKNLLFWASCISLIATSMSFAIRGDISKDLETAHVVSYVAGQMTDEDVEGAYALAMAEADKPAEERQELSAAVKGVMENVKARSGVIVTIWGMSFGLLILLGGPLVDALGMGLLLRLAAACHIGGALLTIFAPSYPVLVAATFIMGAGNGLVEAVCNPLIATIYPEERTHKLTIFHAWFPGGIVIGGLLAFAFSKLGIGWQWKMALVLVPSVIYGLMIFGLKFPKTERAAAGISFGGMFKESLTRPLFWIIWLMMWLTAVTELVPGSWIPNIFQDIFQNPGGILAVVWGSALMFVLRQFCSRHVHRTFSPTALMVVTTPIAAAGLFLFKFAESPPMFFLACTLLYVGVCYWWPTMLGLTSERCPKTGALGLAIIGGSGSFAVSVFGPLLGWLNGKYDPRTALVIWGLLPVVVFVVFLLVFLKDKASGGYQIERLDVQEDAAEA